MDRFRKRKDITPVQSESKKTSTDQRTALDTITSTLASILPRQRSTDTESITSATSYQTKIQTPITTRMTKEKGKPIGNKDLDGIKFGRFRNMIEIDVTLLNGEPMRTSMSEMLAHTMVRSSLKLKRDDIFGIQMAWSGHPVIQLRLNNNIDADLLPPNFCYKRESKLRDNRTVCDEYVCEVRGLKQGNNLFNREQSERPPEDPNGPWTRWVKLEGTGFDFRKNDLIKWLEHFGKLESQIENDVMKFPDEILEEGETEPPMVSIVTGKLAIKMEIREPIPQFLPAQGKKVKVYYRGIDKLCLKCYESGHNKIDCTANTVSWIEYVENFKNAYPEIENQLYGRWNNTLTAWKASKQ